MLGRIATAGFSILVCYAIALLAFWDAGQAPPSLWQYPWFWAIVVVAALIPSRWWLWNDLNPFDDFGGGFGDGGD